MTTTTLRLLGAGRFAQSPGNCRAANETTDVLSAERSDACADLVNTNLTNLHCSLRYTDPCGVQYHQGRRIVPLTKGTRRARNTQHAQPVLVDPVAQRKEPYAPVNWCWHC